MSRFGCTAICPRTSGYSCSPRKRACCRANRCCCSAIPTPRAYGDWLLGADSDRNGPYASAHVIQARSGRDVVSLGLSGAGSVEALALLPSVTYAASRRAWYLRLPAPRIVVVYFYEGNDLNDNLRFLRQHSDAADGTDFPTRLDRALAIYAASPVLPRDRWQALLLLRFLARVGQRRYAELTGAALPVRDVYGVSPATTGPPNVVEVAGRPVGLPANLQSPALELSEPELADTVLVFERSPTSVGCFPTAAYWSSICRRRFRAIGCSDRRCRSSPIWTGRSATRGHACPLPATGSAA